MYHSRVKPEGFLILVFLFISAWVSAQTGSVSNPLSGRENNPYSKFGLGELSSPNTAELNGMAGITSAYEDQFQLNPDNPASYAFLRRSCMEGGAIASTRDVSSSNLSYTTGTMMPGYFMLGVPVGKNGGLSFGIRPYSRSYFSLVDTIFNSPIGSAERSYGGQGSMNYAYFGGAAKYKGLSVGFNFGYLFGTLQSTTSLVPVDTLAINRAYTNVFSNYTGIGGVYWKLGMLYEHKIHDSEHLIRFGATYTLSQNLYETLNAYQTSIYYFGDTTVNDTISNKNQQTGKLKMPSSFSAGLSFARIDHWNLGIDYSATQWNQFNSQIDGANAGMNLNIGTGSQKMALGGEYTPIPVKMHKYISLMSYRAGIYYGKDYLTIDGHPLPMFGVTLGGSMHFKPTHFSWVNLHTSFDIGRVGTTQNNLIAQTYVRWTLAMSFSDKWFIPRKYD